MFSVQYILQNLSGSLLNIIQHFCELPMLKVPQSVSLQTGKAVTTASATSGGKFLIKIEKRTINYVEYVEADYLLIASGSSQQVVMNMWFNWIVMYADYIS